MTFLAKGALAAERIFFTTYGGFLKLGISFWGVPIIRTIVFWGLYWGSRILGNYHVVGSRTLEISYKDFRVQALGYSRWFCGWAGKDTRFYHSFPGLPKRTP